MVTQPQPAPAQRQWPLTLLLYAPVKQARLQPPWPQQQSRQTQVARPASRMSRNLPGANRPTRAAGWTSGAGCSRPGRPCRSLGRTRRPVLPCSTSSEQEQPSLSAALTLGPWSVTRGWVTWWTHAGCVAARRHATRTKHIIAEHDTRRRFGGTGVRCPQQQSQGSVTLLPHLHALARSRLPALHRRSCGALAAHKLRACRGFKTSPGPMPGLDGPV